MIEQHMTTRQVADAMACSTETVLRLAQKGEIPSVFWGRERRYPVSGIEAYLARKQMCAVAPSADVIELKRRGA